MTLKIKIVDNKVYLVRLLFLKYEIGVYSDGHIIIQNEQLINKLKKYNRFDVNLFRKMF